MGNLTVMIKVELSRRFLVKIIIFSSITISLHFFSLLSETNGNGSDIIFPPGSSLQGYQADRNYVTKFDGEFFKYDIGIWVLKKIGVVTLHCQNENDNIIATVTGYTTGMVDAILHRHNIYRTTMVLDKDTNRLKPLSSFEKKIKGKEEKIKITSYDYSKNLRKYEIWKDNVFSREKEIKFNNKHYNDGISAFYNLRNEIYGKVHESTTFPISTVCKDGFSDSLIHFRLIEKTDDVSLWKHRNPKAKFIADIRLDPDVMDSKEGKLIILFTAELIPIGFLAKDVLGYGDLYGVLTDEKN